jgi:hypothetical protein
MTGSGATHVSSGVGEVSLGDIRSAPEMSGGPTTDENQKAGGSARLNAKGEAPLWGSRGNG